jgi:sulfite exporter TauE/SafE
MKITVFDILMYIVVGCALGTVGINIYLEKDFTSISWPLTTLMWIWMTYSYKKEVEKYKNKI